MKYISTRNNNTFIDFERVCLKGLAPDGGLYLPKNWHENNFEYSKTDDKFENIAYNIIKNFVGNALNNKDLKEIIKLSYANFTSKEITPLKKLEDNHWLLELFHGPTLAFKDIALQLLGNLFNFYLEKNNNKINIIGATSGDTGSAALEAVKGNKKINIFILHPLNRVSVFQRRQMTTVKSPNVFNIALKGSFDDCQHIVKKLFNDKDTKEKKFASINSINWTRIMSQITYYVYAFKQLSLLKKQRISFSVPTGNFGDAYAGYLAKSKLNIPLEKIIIATNENDILNRFFRSGEYFKENVKSTNSPSMDIQVASNFERLLYDIFNEDSSKVSEIMKRFETKNNLFIKKNTNKKLLDHFTSFSINETRTLETIKNVYEKYNIVLDPHTAVGYAASLDYLDSNKGHTVVSLATAHPAKFSKAVRESIGKEPMLPSKYRNIFDLEEKYEVLDNNYNLVKDFILKNTLV